jgi:hypothetical protein
MLDWARKKPVALLLPALYAECERPALPRILEEVSQAGHISEVVLSMNGMDAAEHDRALVLMPQKPARQKAHIFGTTARADPCLSAHGRGRTPGVSRGKRFEHLDGRRLSFNAREFNGMVVSHDTDILNYSRDLLWRLTYPLLHPRMGYRFAKGYYSRVSDRLLRPRHPPADLPADPGLPRRAGKRSRCSNISTASLPAQRRVCSRHESTGMFQSARWLGAWRSRCCARPSATCPASISARWISAFTSSTATAACHTIRSA